MNTDVTFLWVGRLVCLVILQQAAEAFALRKIWSHDGFYRWSLIRRLNEPLPVAVEKALNLIFSDRVFPALIVTQMAFAFVGIFISSAWILGALAALGWLMAIRFRPAVNGGSDYFTFIMIFCLAIGSANPRLKEIALGYIAIQCVLSYFISGVRKCVSLEWRQGTALQKIFEFSNYFVPQKIVDLNRRFPFCSRLGNYLVLAFECTFPLALLSKNICLIYLVAGIIFHLINFFVLGLNRFVFTWLASYPAVYSLAIFVQAILDRH